MGTRAQEGLREDTMRLGYDCDKNNNEAKKLRRILIGYAEASLQVMEASFAVVPAVASSPIARGDAKAGPAVPASQSSACGTSGLSRETDGSPVLSASLRPAGKAKMKPAARLTKIGDREEDGEEETREGD